MRKMYLVLIASLLASSLDQSLSGTGLTYFVSASRGNDNNPGTKDVPWKTIQRAGGTVRAGDTVIVESGIYDGVIFGWHTAPCPRDPYCVLSGTASQPILIEADPKASAGTVIIAGRNKKTAIGIDLEPGCNYVNIVGFTVNNDGTPETPPKSITKAGIKVSYSIGNVVYRNIVKGVSGLGGIFLNSVRNVYIAQNLVTKTKGKNTTGHGMYLAGSSSEVHILDNDIYENDYIGIHINGDVSEGLPGVVSHIQIAGNLIHGNGQNGINADGLQSSLIENNVIYGNHRNGISLYQMDAYGGSTNNVIKNNRIDQSMVPGSYAIQISPCRYDNQAHQPIPSGCHTRSGDTSTGNIAFNNRLLGQAGVSQVVSSLDLLLSDKGSQGR
jgi:Right handed beta helix region